MKDDGAPIVAIAPYGARPGPALARLPLAECAIPLGLPPGRAPETVGDLGPGDHVILHPKSSIYLRWPLGIAARISILIAEPRAVHRRHFQLLRLFHRRFFRILTRDEAFIRAVPNAIFHNHIFAWAEDVPDGVEKSRPASIIASDRRSLEGHRLRHRIVDEIRARGLDVDVMGRGYRPFERKWEGLAPYRYSVVIENARERHYISEKLIDACLCRTIPIYWGAPNVGNYVDPAGLVICESVGEIMEALESLPARAPAVIEANRVAALGLLDAEARAARHVLGAAGG